VAAKELGVPGPTLSTWIYQFRDGRLSALPIEQTVTSEEKLMDPAAVKQLKDNLANLLEETKRLNKKIAVLEEERFILKKAAAYFAREQR
jgi:transposase-like protein